jgi:hypothetical protein
VFPRQLTFGTLRDWIVRVLEDVVADRNAKASR